MERNPEELTRVVQALMAHECSIEEAAQKIVDLGLGHGFGIGGDVIYDVYGVEAGRLRELVWNVAQLHNQQHPPRS